jgi:hypothetical protein
MLQSKKVLAPPNAASRDFRAIATSQLDLIANVELVQHRPLQNRDLFLAQAPFRVTEQAQAITSTPAMENYAWDWLQRSSCGPNFQKIATVCHARRFALSRR